LECATRSYETEVENDGPKVSKIGQAERRNEVGKGAENRESWNGEVGAFNIFLVNLTEPFRFIAGLGVQVLSAWVQRQLIFNFTFPSLHFIDGVACRRRHLSHTSLCSWFMRPVRLLRQRIFQRFRRRYPEAPPRSCPWARGVVSAVDRLLETDRSLSKGFSISQKKYRFRSLCVCV